MTSLRDFNAYISTNIHFLITTQNYELTFTDHEVQASFPCDEDANTLILTGTPGAGEALFKGSAGKCLPRAALRCNCTDQSTPQTLS